MTSLAPFTKAKGQIVANAPNLLDIYTVSAMLLL
jgi:hypothetical protein